jgi:putative colanic acid biosynthesis UDP-glucose lipid carrier transferase
MFFDTWASQLAHEAYSSESSDKKAPLQTQAIVKRVFDVVISGLALLCLGPVLLLVAYYIRFESRGPALFRQIRNGKSGETFKIFKFRTMVFEPGAAFEQCGYSDPRLTRSGKFLRRISFDEFPQLINVLRGEMSLVGPRPHPIELDSQYASIIPNYMDRYVVRPGMTGWAQVLGHRGPTPTSEIMAMRLAADLEYVKRWSLGFDLKIFLRTLPALLFPRNVH